MVRWQFETEDEVSAAPAVADGTVVAGSEDGNLYALDVVDGSERWRFEAGIEIAGTPALLDGTVYAGTAGWDDFRVYAIDLERGTERWMVETEGTINTALTAVDGEGTDERSVFALTDPAMDDSALLALDAADGSERWRFTSEYPLETPPTVVRRQVDGDGQADDEESGRLTVFLPNRHRSALTRAYDLMVEDESQPAPSEVEAQMDAQPGGAILGIDAVTGERRLQIGAPGPPVTTPTVVDGTIYVGTRGGTVLAVAPSECSTSSRGSRVRRGTLGHHEETVHGRGKPDVEGVCPNCTTDLSAVDDPSYCWECGWELD